MAEKVFTERDGDVLVVVIDNPPINAGSIDVRRGILNAIRMLAQDPALKAGVLIGGGSTFIAGSDLREFGQALEDPQLPALIAAIEACAKPVVAALHGAALGGGFELALGCDARVANIKTVVGLPEVTLGMVPGAGGTQRLPRIVGVATAIRLICSGERPNAASAKALGIVDAIAPGDLRQAAVLYASNMRAKRRLREQAVPFDTQQLIDEATRAALATGRGRPPVVLAIELVLASRTLPVDEALQRERALFQQLRMSREAAALRHLFFAEREAAKQPLVAEEVSGSIGKRIYGALHRECEWMLEEGATRAQIDTALETFGFLTGPFTAADTRGQDMAGMTRQAQHPPRNNIQPRTIGDDEIVRRAMLAMVNQAACLLSEGVAARPSQIDVVMVQAHGFPRWEGGPVFYAQQRGAAALSADIAWLAHVSGPGLRIGDLAALALPTQ